MKNRPVVLLLFFALAAAGCQGNPQVRRVVDSYNAESRQMEDMIYLLEQDIQVLEQDNAKLRRQIERGGGTSGSGSSSGGGRGRIFPRSGGNPDLNPPMIEVPEIEMPETQTPRTRPAAPRPLNKPALSEELDVGPILDPPANKPTQGSATRVKPTGHEQEAAAEPKKLEPEVTDKVVTHIHLNPLQTCSADFDHAPGDDGITVLIEPRNGANQYVPVAGTISVVVLDPKKSGEDARLARWDFSPAETADKIQQGATRGIQLKLPWPAKPPENARLDVFVRYETPDGTKLQAEKEVVVALPGQFSQRWTPRPADRQRQNHAPAEVARTNEPRFTTPPPLSDIESPAEILPAESETPPSLITPPAGLSERQPGEMPAKPKWAPTR